MALWAAAGIATAALDYSIHKGEEQKGLQERARKAQDVAQQKAETAAISQKRSEEMALAEANKKTPNMQQITDAEKAAAAASNAGGTLLTGGDALSNPSTKLGKRSLLGG